MYLRVQAEHVIARLTNLLCKYHVNKDQKSIITNNSNFLQSITAFVGMQTCVKRLTHGENHQSQSASSSYFLTLRDLQDAYPT